MILRVLWRDAWFDFDRSGADEVREDYIVETVGHLISDGPVFLSLAAEVLPDGDHRAVTHIPLESVLQRVELFQA